MRKAKGSHPAVSITLAAILACPLVVSGQDSIESLPREEIRATFKNMWTLAVASEAYRIDHDTYPKVATVQELIEVVQPLYLPQTELNTIDAWGNPMLVVSNGEDLEIRSMGSDGVLDDAFLGGITTTLETDIVIRNGEYVQYPQIYCEHCSPDFCGVPPDTISIDACRIDFTPSGRMASFVETIVYKVTTGPTGRITETKFELPPKVLDGFLNLEQLECCIKRWVLLPNTEYLVSFRAGTSGQMGTQWEIRVCHSDNPCIQVNIPRTDYECNWLQYQPNRSVQRTPTRASAVRVR